MLKKGQWVNNPIKRTLIKLGFKYCGTWNLELFTSFWCIVSCMYFTSYLFLDFSDGAYSLS